ncbi:MAG: SLC13 family permease [Planctomycetales bacterium]|nr:SLC13 family permease [Planctomycetales bacterium]
MAMAIVAFVFGVLVRTSYKPDVVLIAGVTLMLLLGVISPDEALSGLSETGMVTVGVLFVIATGVRETGGVQWLAERILGRPKSPGWAMARLLAPTAAMSAFLNNTAIVAMLIPAVNEWARKYRIPVSKLMIPLSYAAILGGTCTLIGTSTNLVVNSQIIQYATGAAGAAGEQEAAGGDVAAHPATRDLPATGLGMFEITKVGVPCALVGCLFLLVAGPWLLPDRGAAISISDDPRNYTLEMIVASDCPLVGRTIEEAGLRHLTGVFLAEIERDGDIIAAVSPTTRLQADDRLVFVGVVESVVDLHKIRGLLPATDQVFKLESPRSERCLVEAVVSDSCPVVGKTIRDGRFRSRYNAVVIAVARNGERINKKIGDIVLKAGDTLLLETQSWFADTQRNSRDFFLVSQLEDSNPPRHEKALIALAIIVGMVALVTVSEVMGSSLTVLGLDLSLGRSPMLKASMLAAGLMLITGCCSARAARRNVDWSVLLTIAAAVGLAKGLQVTGASRFLASTVTGVTGDHQWVSLVVVYLTTLVATELITHIAAAVLVFPIAMEVAARVDASAMPFAIVVMMAASAGFATPIGYQTNLMVYGPGGYRFSDYCRIGIPLDLLICATAVTIIPLVWPF